MPYRVAQSLVSSVQELFTLPEHLNSPNVVSGVRVAQSLVSSVQELFTLPEHLNSPTVVVKDIKGEIRCRNSNKTKGRKDKK
jgi:hypothetical protein